MRVFTILAFLATLIVGAFGTSAATTPLVFFRETGMYFINSDSTGLKLLDGDGAPAALWISQTEVVYRKQLNLWKINIKTGLAEQLTTEGLIKNPKAWRDEDEFGGYIDVDCPVINKSRNELYYRVIDLDTFEVQWKVMNLKTRQIADFPEKWGSITDAVGDKIYGDFGSMPSRLVVWDLKTGEAKPLTEARGIWGDCQARISPDGTLLAFSRNMQIWLYDLTKNTTRFLYQKAQKPDWSPDGNQLLCQNHMQTKVREYQYDQIIVVNLDGTAKILVQGKDYQDGAQFLHPAGWTKDGNIVWSQMYSGMTSGGYWHRSDIKLVDPRTGAKSLIVKNGDNNQSGQKSQNRKNAHC